MVSKTDLERHMLKSGAFKTDLVQLRANEGVDDNFYYAMALDFSGSRGCHFLHVLYSCAFSRHSIKLPELFLLVRLVLNLLWRHGGIRAFHPGQRGEQVRRRPGLCAPSQREPHNPVRLPITSHSQHIHL